MVRERSTGAYNTMNGINVFNNSHSPISTINKSAPAYTVGSK